MFKACNDSTQKKKIIIIKSPQANEAVESHERTMDYRRGISLV